MIMKNTLKVSSLHLLTATFFIGFSVAASAQNVDDIRWKTEEQVRSILGEPQSTTSPVGTHASYTLWQYETYTVAFANNRAFHLFNKNSLRKLALDENRGTDDQDN